MTDATGKTMGLEEARAKRSLDLLDTAAYIWLGDVDIPGMIANVTSPMKLRSDAPEHVRDEFRARMNEQVQALIHMAFVEGCWRVQDMMRDTINDIRAQRDSALSDAARVREKALEEAMTALRNMPGTVNDPEYDDGYGDCRYDAIEAIRALTQPEGCKP